MSLEQDALTSKMNMLKEFDQNHTAPSVISGASLLKFKDKKSQLSKKTCSITVHIWSIG